MHRLERSLTEPFAFRRIEVLGDLLFGETDGAVHAVVAELAGFDKRVHLTEAELELLGHLFGSQHCRPPTSSASPACASGRGSLGILPGRSSQTSCRLSRRRGRTICRLVSRSSCSFLRDHSPDQTPRRAQRLESPASAKKSSKARDSPMLSKNVVHPGSDVGSPRGLRRVRSHWKGMTRVYSERQGASLPISPLASYGTEPQWPYVDASVCVNHRYRRRSSISGNRQGGSRCLHCQAVCSDVPSSPRIYSSAC